MNKKVIFFDVDKDESKELFEMMYESTIVWGSLRTVAGRTVLAREDAMLLRLEEISEVTTREIRAGEFARVLDYTGDFEVTNKDIDFLIEYIGNCPWSAGKTGGRKAIKAINFLEAMKDGPLHRSN